MFPNGVKYSGVSEDYLSFRRVWSK